MKVTQLILAIVLVTTLSACGKDKNVASNAMGGCVLDQPIEMTDLTSNNISFDQVVTNEGSARAFEIFMILNGNAESGLIGGAIWDQNGNRHGFANSYTGTMNLHDEVSGNGDVKVETITENYPADKNLVKHEMKVAFSETQLLGISITFPSGDESKTLCVKSMRLRK